MINGLEGIDGGEIVVDGIHLPGGKKDIQNVRREVGMVFQSFNLFMHMSVRQNLILAPMTARGLGRKEADDRAERLLERVGIGDQINIRASFPAASSSGWRSPAPWRWSQGSCCSTSRPAPSTPK